MRFFDKFLGVPVSDISKYISSKIELQKNERKNIFVRKLDELKKADQEKSEKETKIKDTVKQNVMLETNYDYLKDQIKYAGFGEAHTEDLRAKMNSGKTEFTLEHSAEVKGERVDAVLNFSKSKEKDMYFFNSYDLKIDNADAITQNQRFYIDNRNENITLNEGHNMMLGRAVEKQMFKKEPELVDGKPVLNEQGKEVHTKEPVWRQLDEKHPNKDGGFRVAYFSPNYGFNLEDKIKSLPIKELENDIYTQNIVESLKKGNRQAVTDISGSVPEKKYIEANAQFKAINAFKSDRGRDQSRFSSLAQSGKQNTESKKEQKSTADGEDAPKQAPKRTRGRKVA